MLFVVWFVILHFILGGSVEGSLIMAWLIWMLFKD